MKYSIFLWFAVITSCSLLAPPLDKAEIRLNQLGYYEGGKKRFIVAEIKGQTSFKVIRQSDLAVVLKGELEKGSYSQLSGETISSGDFSTLETSGTYFIRITGLEDSFPFDISANVLQDAFKASIKALYFQRASTGLEAEHAGEYAREQGHPDRGIPFHSSVEREGTINSAKGWYDAGDYGKYVVNGAYSLGQLLTLVEHYPDIISDGDLNIPESGNGISDLLDELKYEMDWLLTMQDADGGVFFKVTCENFEGMVMPKEATKQRYVFKESTASTLDFAAVAAKFSRAYSSFDADYAQKCLESAEKAWEWALENPAIAFKNPKGVVTGEYGDENFTQEFFWAAAELYVSTGDQAYLDYQKDLQINFNFLPGASWANHVHYLGAFALIDHGNDSTVEAQMKETIVSLSDHLITGMKLESYYQPVKNFQWGSNSDVMNTAYILAQAYRIIGDKKYLSAVQEITDYVFGKNAVGYSFVTGFGTRTPLHIHHRPSEGDDILEPIPGFLAGGANFSKQDKWGAWYSEPSFEMTSWVDHKNSYASNEICLNWNAPLSYVLGFLEEESN